MLKSALGKMRGVLLKLKGHDQKLDIRKLASKYDYDNDQKLDRHEFSKFMDEIAAQIDFSDQEKLILIKAADKNHDGFIDIEEFLEFVRNDVKIE